MAIEDEEAGMESTSSWRSSSEQQQALLGDHDQLSKRYKSWTKKEALEDDDDAFCFIIRWWHLVTFLILCTVSVPAVVKQYVLASDWDFSSVPKLREYTWNLTETEYNPDGVYRPMLVINNQFPGPLIEVNEGDTIRVTVQNQMSNSTAIHFHGIYQNGTNWMDGTVGITQCPIAPGHTFTYEFTVSNQSGTYWYHAHQSVQSSDGLHGPLIIHSRDERSLQQIQYVTDRIVMVSDHYHDLSSELVVPYLAPDNENAEPVPDGALINGRAIRNCDDLPHRKCDNRTGNVGVPTFALESDQYHRLRIINVGAFAEFQFQVDEHQLAVTEVDGTDVIPAYFHRLNINPAQRYSVILRTNNTRMDSYRMRARMITTCFAEPNPYMVSEVHASPDSMDWSQSQDLECRDLNTTELVPVQAIAAPDRADAYYYIRSNFEIGAHQLSRGFFNASSWRPDVHDPTLARAVDGLKASNASYSPATADGGKPPAVFVNDAVFDTRRELVVQSSGTQTIDLLISNFDDGNHPMHLHGYKYFVLAQGHGYPPRKSRFEELTRDNVQPLYDSLELTNPLRRDTASVEAFGWILIRFVADNPGAWPLHCHISWHTEAGLLMQFLTRTDLMAEFVVPEANQALCAAEGLEKGTGPKDEDYY
ncbi:putative multicopper oxidase, type 1 [Delphinella strobiligena]|nr:putative multicopper oxidase, type 1 [Delphinella strobiligena]